MWRRNTLHPKGERCRSDYFMINAHILHILTWWPLHQDPAQGLTTSWTFTNSADSQIFPFFVIPFCLYLCHYTDYMSDSTAGLHPSQEQRQSIKIYIPNIFHGTQQIINLIKVSCIQMEWMAPLKKKSTYTDSISINFLFKWDGLVLLLLHCMKHI